MELVIVSGLSGAGKSSAADFLEDMGYFCVDNMPPQLFSRFADFCLQAGDRFEKVALVTDVRSRAGFKELSAALQELKDRGVSYKLLFLECSDRTLVRRYKETRRRHPLQTSGRSLQQTVEAERALLADVRAIADYVVDTDRCTLGQLSNTLRPLFTEEEGQGLPVTVMSFGYKYGIPTEADLVFDARFLPNPYYVEELRELTGLDERVRSYVMNTETAAEFLSRLTALLEWLIPRYAAEGKTSLTVAVGCTGGRHRSVSVAMALTDALVQKGMNAAALNRDCGRGSRA